MSKLILALDVLDEKKAMDIATKTAPYLHAIKVGYPLVLSSGMNIVEKLSRIKPVICDFKVADIPNTNRLITEIVRSKGAYGIIVHGFTGPDSVKAVVENAGNLHVYVIAEMSHPGATYIMQQHTDDIVRIARETGAHGLIAPATRPERLNHIRKIAGNMEILSPGVGAQGGKAREAIEAGADKVIVGRSIYNASDPAEAARRIHEELESI